MLMIRWRILTERIEDFNAAIKLKSDYVKAYNNRGNAYRKKGEFDKALADFDTAISLKVDFAGAYNSRRGYLPRKRES